MFIRPSEIKQYDRFEIEKENEKQERYDHDQRNPDTGVPHGDTGRGLWPYQLNPVREEKKEQQREGNTQSTPAEKAEEENEMAEQEKDGLRPGVAADDEIEEAGGEEEGEEAREVVAAPAPIAPSRMEREKCTN